MSDPIDIVERLSEPCNSGEACKVLVLEAAAEITRLRAALAAQVPQPVSVPEAPALDWPQMLMLINAYAGHVADAAQHQAASRADISHAAALKALTDIRMAMAAHTSRWQALVHELIWRASPPPAALAVPDGWTVRDRSDLEAGAIDLTSPTTGRVVLLPAHRDAHSRTLYELAAAMLAAPQESATTRGRG